MTFGRFQVAKTQNSGNRFLIFYSRKLLGDFSLKTLPGANPATLSYNASATNSMARFYNKIFFSDVNTL
jgi:hypothetical protein